MDNYVAPEIRSYAEQVARSTLGSHVKVDFVEWSAGGLYNKVFYIHI